MMVANVMRALMAATRAMMVVDNVLHVVPMQTQHLQTVLTPPIVVSILPLNIWPV